MTAGLAVLDRALLAAHAADDKPALIRLYTAAADAAEQRQEGQAAAFYLTHAFVFALETGAREAPDLNKRLADKGCAHRLDF